MKKRTYHVLVGLAAVAVAGIVAASVRISLLPDETPTSQPAPPGKVWSAEHGHYHDAPFTTGPTQVPLPQSSGSPAPGQVWSEEHQHWHQQ